MMKEIEKFIADLAASKGFENSRNLYLGNNNASHIRKTNLTLYLNEMKNINPSVLLLGEAPGYKGCGLTGIAFTSEKIIKTKAFFTNKKYLISSSSRVESEVSATIVWNEIDKSSSFPLLWNIFPFHPHKKNDFKSNRTPTKEELQYGTSMLKKLLIIFDIKNIIAVGRKAEQQIQDLDLKYKYVRHPANGGKNKFVEGYRSTIMN